MEWQSGLKQQTTICCQQGRVDLQIESKGMEKDISWKQK